LPGVLCDDTILTPSRLEPSCARGGRRAVMAVTGLSDG
jgi:hypothetical protein